MIDRATALRAAAAGAAGAIAVRALLEARHLEITTHVVRARRGTPARSVRLVQLSDLHVRGSARLERQLVHAVLAARPDVIVITGDTISSRPALGPLDRLLSRIEGVAPTFAVPGNWDRWSGVSIRELRESFARRGMRLLVNETVRLDFDGQPLRITGVDDLVSGSPSARAGLAEWKPGETHVVLAHCPTYRERLWKEVAERRAGQGWSSATPPPAMPALLLAGHTHGGQIRLLRLAPIRPQGSGRYVAGWYRDERPHMYVSRGIGTSVVQVRFGSPPEMAVFDVDLPQ